MSVYRHAKSGGGRALGLALVLASVGAGGCSGGPLSAPMEFHSESGGPRAREAGPGVVRMMWTKPLLDWYHGDYIPTESAAPALDAARDRIFQGTSQGKLYAFDSSGRLHATYDAGEAIEATPAVDSAKGEVYVAVVDGSVHALDALTLERRWKSDIGHAFRTAPILTDDAIFLAAEDDYISAISREDGGELWAYRRPPGEAFAVAGQAGIRLVDGRLYTGFSDGVVVSLEPTDGSVLWEIDTSGDVDDVESNRPTFADIDTTPAVVGDQVFVASYAGGIYALSKSNGTLEWRDESFTGVVRLAAAGPWLIALSARHGVAAIEPLERKLMWRRPVERGAPTSVQVLEDRAIMFYGESRGSMVAVSIRDGRELARLDMGHGFTANASVEGAVGAAFSNAGRLLVFSVAPEL